MAEEFHGADPYAGPWKLLYGWGTLNTNIWLPSLSELVGISPDKYDTVGGCYFSGMQGLNVSAQYWTDARGGVQLSYFKQYNASGGGQAIWDACNREVTWLRSPVFAYADKVNTFSSTNGVWHADSPLTPCAVHPAVETPKRVLTIFETRHIIKNTNL